MTKSKSIFGNRGSVLRASFVSKICFSLKIDRENPHYCHFCKSNDFSQPIIEHFKKCPKANSGPVMKEQKAEEKPRRQLSKSKSMKSLEEPPEIFASRKISLRNYAKKKDNIDDVIVISDWNFSSNKLWIRKIDIYYAGTDWVVFQLLVWVYFKFLGEWSSKADTEVLESTQEAANKLFVALKWIEVWGAFCANGWLDDGFALLDLLGKTEETLDDWSTVGWGDTHCLGRNSEKGTDFHFYSFWYWHSALAFLYLA